MTDLAAWVDDARRRTLEMYADLDDVQIVVPYLRIVNPPIWELGHIAWFQEHWVLRRALGGDPERHGSIAGPGADALWNSAIVPHATRWTLPLSRAGAIEYLEIVR